MGRGRMGRAWRCRRVWWMRESGLRGNAWSWYVRLLNRDEGMWVACRWRWTLQLRREGIRYVSSLYPGLKCGLDRSARRHRGNCVSPGHTDHEDPSIFGVGICILSLQSDHHHSMGKWNNKNQLYFMQVDVSVSRPPSNIMVSYLVRRVASFNALKVKLVHMFAFCGRIHKHCCTYKL